MKNKLLFIFIILLGAGKLQAHPLDTVTIYFPHNEAKLQKESAHYIDSLIFNDVLIHGQKYSLLGYADYAGGGKYNKLLSQKRAKDVMSYLLSMGFEANDIKLVKGMGKINTTPSPYENGIANDRKVQIIIDGRPAVRPTIAPAAINLKKKLGDTKVNQSIPLKNLVFEGDRHHLLMSSRLVLDTIVLFMQENSNVKIQIEGHICCMDPSLGHDKLDADSSGMLSETRAKMVYDFLVRRGIKKDRIKAIGYGNTKPLVPDTANLEEQALNRRVEIRILSK